MWVISKADLLAIGRNSINLENKIYRKIQSIQEQEQA
jgi:hypothetical protein